MAEPKSFIADPVLAKQAVSPLAGHVQTGEFGALRDEGPGVILSERFGLSIVEVAAWKSGESKCRAAIKAATGLTLKTAPGSGTVKPDTTAFNIAPARWLVSGEDAEHVAKLAESIGDNGSVVDLSHGRSVLRIDGRKSRWVLSKLFAIDFAEEAFAKADGLSTIHHDFMVQIQRADDDAFDIYVFRSFARSFWHVLCRSSEEVGYRVL
ncbi:MAG: sarcosine oxidase subunit gamma [Ahrensia sp.]|nr:sarcosine oxidase subunit gamma [Ahrensia sp.]